MEPTVISLGAAVIVALVTVIGILWRKSNEWEDRWKREVKRGVQLALSVQRPSDPMPEPEWDESTRIRQNRKQLEHSAKLEMDRALQDYLESTPPDRPVRK